MRNIFVALVAISILAGAVWATAPLAGHKVPSMSAWDNAAVAARYVEVNASGSISTAPGTSSLSSEFSVTTFAAGTTALTLTNAPAAWVITNLDSTDTVYFGADGDTGDATAADYQIIPGASLSGNSSLQSFQLYAADTASVQIYAEY